MLDVEKGWTHKFRSGQGEGRGEEGEWGPEMWYERPRFARWLSGQERKEGMK